MTDLFLANSGAISYSLINGVRHWTSWPNGITRIVDLVEFEKVYPKWRDVAIWKECND